jgi:CRISPR/Cas system-associated exonuclease Cas4 (RecB family)
MFEVIFRWNSCGPDDGTNEFINKITLRGYIAKNVGLTGEFINKLIEQRIKPLSIGNITSRICPTGRDIYYRKGPNPIRGRDESTTWGRETGNLIEQYYYNILPRGIKTHKQKYTSTKKQADKHSIRFFETKQEKLNEIIELEKTSNKQEGDTEWLVKILNQSARSEFAIKILNKISYDPFNIDTRDVQIKPQLHPSLEEIGIAPSEPDFIIPKHKIIGDIKSGENFEDYFLLTCTGYALAYENEFQTDINWGVIYFVPKHTTSEYVKVLTYPQVHFFPIDEKLREWFLEKRDEAYSIISKKDAPGFPKKLVQCPYCKYKTHCVGEGLQLNNT